MQLIVRGIVIASIVITITDIIFYVLIKRNPERLTIPFLIGMIVVTIIPIAVNFYVHFPKS